MKKINIFLAIILAFTMSIGAIYASGKSANTNYNDRTIFIDSKEGKTKEFKLKDNTTIKLNYKHSEGKTNTKLVYEDENGITYEVDKQTNKLINVNFLNKERDKNKEVAYNNKRLDLEEIKNIAEKYIIRYIDLEEYKFDKYTKTDYYSFIWNKKVENINSTDFAYIDIDKNGNLLSFGTSNKNIKYTAIKNVNSKNLISMEKAKSIIEKDFKNKDSKFTYEFEKDPTLYINKDQKTVWMCLVKIRVAGSSYTSDLLIYTVDAITGEIIEVE